MRHFSLSRASAWAAAGLLSLGALAGQAQTTGAFRVSDGQFLQPDGTKFLARGVNVTPYDNYAPSLYPAVKSLFPGINFIRLVTGYNYTLAQGGQTKPTVDQFIAAATADKVVVLVDNHTQATVHTGSDLTKVCNWYAQFATAYKNNPYVWFNTSNEPDGNYGDIAAEELAIYNAIRNAGNNNPILMALQGGSYTDWRAGLGSTWSGMHNVGWDLHFYSGWTSHYSPGSPQYTDYATLAGRLSLGMSTAQQFQSADGLMPIHIGEFGPSMSGAANSSDPNGQTTLDVVFGNGVGWTAWALTGTAKPGGDCLYGDDEANGQLTSWGQQVAAKIAAGTGSGGGAAPTAGLVSGGVYKLLARHSGQALDVDGGGGANEKKVQQWTATDNNPNQEWRVDLQTDGTYTLTHNKTNACLDVKWDAAQDGTVVWQYAANPTSSTSNSQRWEIRPTDNGYYKLLHKGTNKCLDVDGGNGALATGTKVQLWEFLGGQNYNQQWQFQRLSVSAARAAAPSAGAASANAPAAPSALSVYPNPATAGQFSVRLSLNQAGTVELRLLDGLGRVVRTQRQAAGAGAQALPFDARSLPAGLYQLRVQVPGTPALTQKVVLQ